MGRPLGFYLLNTFDGVRCVYFGNFTALRGEAVLWRLRTLEDIVHQRLGSLPERVRLGFAVVTPEIIAAVEAFLAQLQIMVLVTSEEERATVRRVIAEKPMRWPVEVFSLGEIATALQNVG